LTNGGLPFGESKNEKAYAAYEKSLALQPRNAPLWFRLYQGEARFSATSANRPGAGSKTATVAREYLDNAAKSDPNNALFWYLAAELDFRAAPYPRVLETESARREQVWLR
jgi:predicted Zn-dependent protease